MISAKQRTQALFRSGLYKALNTAPLKGMEVTKSFFKELAQAVKNNPDGCIIRCQNQSQADEATRWLAKKRLTQYTVKIVEEKS